MCSMAPFFRAQMRHTEQVSHLWLKVHLLSPAGNRGWHSSYIPGFAEGLNCSLARLPTLDHSLEVNECLG